MSTHEQNNAAYNSDISLFAREAAGSIKPGGRVSASAAVKEAESDLALIKSVMKSATAYAEAHVTIPQEVEWLLDNWYIAEREGKSAISDMKTAPKMNAVEPRRNRLLVSEAACALVRYGRGCVTSEQIEAYLDAFSEVICLSEAELSFFIPALRLALVGALAGGCRKLRNVIVNGVVEDDLAGLLGRLFTSLRFLSGFDASRILENVNRVERTLRCDPTGVYPQMDEQTRYSYRREIAWLAEQNRQSAYEVAGKILLLARSAGSHVGYFIFTKPLGQDKKKRTGALYITFILLASLFLSLLISFLLDRPALALLLLLPVSEFVKNITDFFVLKFVRPQRVPRLELSDGVPDEGRTLCVISLLLTSAEGVSHTAQLLEEYRLSNRDAGRNLVFGLLADVPDAPSESHPNDEVYIRAATEAINRLNQKYNGGFFLFARGRRFNARDKQYTAWERKRGAILELCRFLHGQESSLRCLAGDNAALTGVAYLINLDNDTRLNAGTARELIGAALHPLNRPILDRKKGIVTAGCGIIQPRISVDLTAANQTDYTRIFAGQGGIDPYGGMTSDIYQNLVGCGSFSGKGIIQIDAYLSCLDHCFPENTVLSHDLLEGSYLRCAYAGDIELTDGFPAKVTTFYDRMHRWTRGDWQALPWLFRRVKKTDGSKSDNCLCEVDRWKIADNVRRSLVPVFTFASLALGMLLDNNDFLWAAGIAVLSAVSHLIITSASGVFARHHGRVRYQTTIISGFKGQVLQSLIKLILLPYEAWVCFHAILTALYRMLISHRNMLSWVTAADAERRSKNTVVHTLRKMWPAVMLSVLIAVFTPFIAAMIIGIIWALSPILVIAISRDNRKKEHLAAEDRLLLSRFAGDIWRYFDELMTFEDHWLPPDNFQEQPAVGVAHRTSPTNIGLGLLAALAAYDLGACSRERAVETITRTIETIERMPKWNGHLYNWYDTLTLRILQPAYVSTVDSGNLVGCLIALREGLKELGEASLAERADRLLSAMRFTPLFDTKRQLFYIGFDVTQNAPTEGWYDLLASEARQTSYIAVARGDIPRKHWRRLGRSLVAMDGYRGMASWTGTMFEYFMPELLLPYYQNSLIDESLRFCLYVQRKRAQGYPWGMSESSFYAFDHTLSYRYKAHGVQRLALKRGMGREAVVSPYSTFLALPMDIKESIANLKRLLKLGIEGRYGLYEAVDFPPNRLRSGKYEVVRSYMAHHLGMSIVAIDNALGGGIMQRRFMRDREMASFAELLQEKVPVGGIILRQPPRDVPEKPTRAVSSRWVFRSSAIDYRNPRCTLLGNNAYTVIASETGQSSSFWNGVAMTRTSSDQWGPDTGMSFYLSSGDELISLLPSPAFDKNIHYACEMTGAYCRIDAKNGGVSSAVTITVPEDEAGELRVVEITSAVRRDAELVCYFEPVLSRQSDYDAHPAFSKLSLETEIIDGAVVVRRRPRARGRGIALAFDSDCPMTFDTSREAALGRGGILSMKRALHGDAGSTTGAVLDPCVLARVKVQLEPGTTCRVAFALTTASTSQAAAAAAKRIIQAGERTGYSRLDASAQQMSLTDAQIESAMALLPAIVYPSPDRKLPQDWVPALRHGQQSLWCFGISGDLPIVSAVIESENDIESAKTLIPLHRLLSENGISFDMVCLVRGGGDYRNTLSDKLLDALKEYEHDNRIGTRGGIHMVDLSAEGAGTIRAVSVLTLTGDKPVLAHPRNDTDYPAPRRFYDPHAAKPLDFKYNEDNSVSLDIRGELPYNAWSHMLANSDYGFLASDAGTGHMWHLNARENKINNWLNDSLATDGTEKLELVLSGERAPGDRISPSDRLSLFAAPDGYDCRVTYGFGWAEWRKTVGAATFVTTAFVPPDTAARILIIEAVGQERFEVSYGTDLVLAPDPEDAVYVTTSRTPDAVSARNTYNTDFPDTVFHLTASEPENAFTCERVSWLTGTFNGWTGTGVLPCAAAVYAASKTLVIVTGCDQLSKLRTLANIENARQKLRETIGYWKSITSKLVVRTPSDELNHYINGWALYQTLCCRIFGRSSLYQSGGAYGFRDQLQDITAVVDAAPDIARAHLIRAARHQFLEGDVQHWWHPIKSDGVHGDKGVRTQCSDDLLWLPYALCVYAEKSGDTTIFDEKAPYIESQPLSEDEDERYEQPKISEHSETLLDHAIKAVDLVLKRGTGRHGLCLIGSGDWNDGMNLVGAGGEGESVWLTWFAVVAALKMAAVCQERQNPGAASRFTDAAAMLKKAAEDAWDGDWFIRGYYDDGSPLGSCVSEECRIDSIAQSFAALADANIEKTKTALTSAVDRLYDGEHRIIRLFDPPFATGLTTPGYIKGYSPGFRENGGQYTHGAVWLAMGLLMAGMTDEGWKMLETLLPQGRPNALYRTEPYVLAADIYTAPGHVGRGGWTWYTGAAGWYYRVATENLLGLLLKNGVLHVRPNLPSSWNGFEADYMSGGKTYRIKVENGNVSLTCDGAPVTDNTVVADPSGHENLNLI
jgi:cyclic beta-1,2-glucan synthetase